MGPGDAKGKVADGECVQMRDIQTANAPNSASTLERTSQEAQAESSFSEAKFKTDFPGAGSGQPGP